VTQAPLTEALCRALVDRAADARLSFQVLGWLEAGNNLAAAPSECLKKLLSQVREGAARSALQRCHARRIVEGCAQRGIPVILMKGLWLAEQVYRSPGARDACDIDLLLRPVDVPAFAELARELGFAPPQAGTRLEAYAGRTNEFPLQHGSGVLVDVHWAITHPVTEVAVDEESLWRRSEMVELAGTQCRMLNLEDHLLYLCFHAAVHHQLWALGPRCLCDVAMVLRQPPRAIRWDELVSRANELGWQRAAWLMFVLVREHLGVAAPEDVMRALHPGSSEDAEVCRLALESIFAGQTEGGPHHQLARLLGMPTWRERAGAIRDLIFPSRAQMANQFGTEKSLWRLHLRRWYTRAHALWATCLTLLTSPRHRAELSDTGRIQSWLMPQVRRTRPLTGFQYVTGAIALFALPAFAVLVRCMSLSRLLAWIEREQQMPDLRLAVDEAAAAGRAVSIAAARGPWTVKCLTRSLVLHWLLRRRGIASDLRIGVAGGGEFRAHAWVECGGVPVNDRPDIAKLFTAFESLSVDGGRVAP
jgi:hypothetical protein